jgi:putative hemolysin
MDELPLTYPANKKVKMKWILTLSISLILLTTCAAPVNQQIATPVSTDIPQATMPNPASAYCVEHGFKSEIRTAADGSQSGVCIFPDGSECDEWAYFRGECKPTTQITDTPVSTESVYAPELVTPDPSLYANWMKYVDSGYGFSFRYPPEWTAELDLRSDSTTYQHLLWLKAPGKPVEGVQLGIAFERVGENYGLQRTGIGSGELIERGKVLFLGEETPRLVLSLEGTDMEVMYGHTGAFERGTLRFAISLHSAGTERIGLTDELEQTSDLIVASFELEK